MKFLMLQILKQRIFAHKCPGGTARPSLLLQNTRVNKNFFFIPRTQQQENSNPRNAVELNSKLIRRKSKISPKASSDNGMQINKVTSCSNQIKQPTSKSKTLLFTLMFGTRDQLIRMQIPPAFQAKSARESHSNVKLPNAKQKIQDV